METISFAFSPTLYPEDLPPVPPLLVRQKNEMKAEEDIMLEKTNEEASQQDNVSKNRSSSRSYVVHINHGGHVSTTTVNKSSAQAATAHVCRAHIRSFPLRTPIKINTKSSKKFHEFLLERKTDNDKHRKFSLVRARLPVSANKITEDLQIPKELIG